jgi:DNA-directed RNA polymerase specialized sigma24 family protein
MSRTAPAWGLNPAAFDRLLAFLDGDRDRAAAKYEDIRHRLLKLFEWRECADPAGLADETIDRVARRLGDGVTIASTDPYAYFHGVATNVVREQWRAPAAEPLDPGKIGTPTNEPPAEERHVRERRLTCLERCLDDLPAGQRTILVDYHTGERHIERRQQIAARLGIPMNALRIRVHRIRTSVEQCVNGCVRGDGA